MCLSHLAVVSGHQHLGRCSLAWARFDVFTHYPPIHRNVYLTQPGPSSLAYAVMTREKDV